MKRPIMAALLVPLVTFGLLIASNLFMTFAWYGHLNFKAAPPVCRDPDFLGDRLL